VWCNSEAVARAPLKRGLRVILLDIVTAREEQAAQVLELFFNAELLASLVLDDDVLNQ